MLKIGSVRWGARDSEAGACLGGGPEPRGPPAGATGLPRAYQFDMAAQSYKMALMIFPRTTSPGSGTGRRRSAAR